MSRGRTVRSGEVPVCSAEADQEILSLLSSALDDIPDLLCMYTTSSQSYTARHEQLQSTLLSLGSTSTAGNYL